MIKMLLELLMKASEWIDAFPENIGFLLAGMVLAYSSIVCVLGVKEVYRIAKELLAEAKERRARAQEGECGE